MSRDLRTLVHNNNSRDSFSLSPRFLDQVSVGPRVRPESEGKTPGTPGDPVGLPNLLVKQVRGTVYLPEASYSRRRTRRQPRSRDPESVRR